MIQVLLNSIPPTIVYLLIEYSFSRIYFTLRFFHLAHATSLTLGAYFVYTGVIIWEWSMWIAIPIAIIVTILLMIVVNFWIYRPLQNYGVANWQMMIASLGLYIVMQNVISIVWGDSTLSFRNWETKVGHELLGAFITDIQIISFVVSVILLVLSWLFVEKTNIGRQIKAISSNSQLSTILGVSRNKAITWSVALGTGLAACASILIAADTDMTPTMGFNWLLYAVVALIISGMGKMRHLLLGALLLATAQHMVAYYLDSKWMNAVAYIILIVFLFFRPSGFSGKQIKKNNL